MKPFMKQSTGSSTEALTLTLTPTPTVALTLTTHGFQWNPISPWVPKGSHDDQLVSWDFMVSHEIPRLPKVTHEGLTPTLTTHGCPSDLMRSHDISRDGMNWRPAHARQMSGETRTCALMYQRASCVPRRRKRETRPTPARAKPS